MDPSQYPTKFGNSLTPLPQGPPSHPYTPALSRLAASFRVFDGFLLIIDHDFGRAAADAQGTPEIPPVAKAAGAPVPVALSRLDTLW